MLHGVQDKEINCQCQKIDRYRLDVRWTQSLYLCGIGSTDLLTIFVKCILLLLDIIFVSLREDVIYVTSRIACDPSYVMWNWLYKTDTDDQQSDMGLLTSRP